MVVVVFIGGCGTHRAVAPAVQVPNLHYRVPAEGTNAPAPQAGEREAAQGSPHSAEAPSLEPAVQQEIAEAVAVIDELWSQAWPIYFTGSYSPPSVHGAYAGGVDLEPRCGGLPLEEGNALYCPEGDFLAWDIELMNHLYSRGDSMVWFVVAHEWAHAIQQRLHHSIIDVAAELQADCLAGAALAEASDLALLRWEDGDSREIVEVLSLVADDLPWADPADHGDVFERIESYNLGRRGGIAACFPGS